MLWRKKKEKKAAEDLGLSRAFWQLLDELEDIGRSPRPFLEKFAEGTKADLVGICPIHQSSPQIIRSGIWPSVGTERDDEKRIKTIRGRWQSGLKSRQGNEVVRLGSDEKIQDLLGVDALVIYPISIDHKVMGSLFWGMKQGQFPNGQQPIPDHIANCIVKLLQIVYERDHKIESERLERQSRLDFVESLYNLLDIRLSNIYRRIPENLTTLLNLQFASLWIFNELDDTLSLRAIHDPVKKVKISNFQRVVAKYENTLMSMCLSREQNGIVTGRPGLVSRSAKWDTLHRNMNIVRKLNLEHLLIMPILRRDRSLLGVINLYLETEKISEEKIKILFALTTQISMLIELGIERQRRALESRIQEFFPRILQLDGSQKIWDDIAKHISKVVDCKICSILFRDEDGELLVLKGSTGVREKWEDKPYSELFYSIGSGYTGKCAELKHTIIVYNQGDKEVNPLAEWHADHDQGEGFEEDSQGNWLSLIFVPIFDPEDKEEVIGVIRCNNKNRDDNFQKLRIFTKEDHDVLSIFAQTLAIFHRNYGIIEEKEHQKDEFIQNLSHEALAPLNAIMGHAGFLQRFHNNPTIRARFNIERKYKALVDEAQHLNSIISAIPVMQNLEQYRFEETRIYQDIFSSCISITESLAEEKGLKLHYEFLSRPEKNRIPLLYLDRKKIHQVLYNLLMNAIKYADNNTNIKILEGETLTHYTISFQNDGLEIPRGEEKVIFRLYGRGSNAKTKHVTGTGTGLYLCKLIMERHNGDITLDRNGNPTIFTIHFPKTLEDWSPL